MGIYIPEMELPTGCYKCPMFEYDYDCCKLTKSDAIDYLDDNLDLDLDLNKNRLPDCPLIAYED